MSSTIRVTRKSVLAASLAAILLSGAAVAQAYGNRGMAPDWRDPVLTGTVYEAGQLVKDQLQQAQSALDAKIVPRATGHLRMTLNAIDKITGSIPYRSLMRNIREARLAIHDHDPLLTAGYLRSLRAALDRTAQTMPYVPRTPAKALGYLDRTEQALHFTDKETADWRNTPNYEQADWKQADAILKSLRDYIDDHTSYVPLDYIAGQVRSALSALDNPEPDYRLADDAVGEALTVTIGSWVDDKVIQTEWHAEKETADRLHSQRAAMSVPAHWGAPGPQTR